MCSPLGMAGLTSQLCELPALRVQLQMREPCILNPPGGCSMPLAISNAVIPCYVLTLLCADLVMC